MVDLAATLEQFQDALSQGLIVTGKCEAHEHLHVLHDDADGMARVTYARIVGGEAQALVAFIPVAPINEIPCLNVGLAVAPAHRGKGLGTQILGEALIELELFLTRGNITRYCVEGVASIHNVPSNAICRRLISEHPKRVVCKASGEDAYQYVKQFQAAAKQTEPDSWRPA